MDETGAGSSMDPVTTDMEDASFLDAQVLIAGFVVSMTLKAAIELGLLDKLSNAAGRALTAEELAEQLPAADKATAAALVDRMLRFLASFNVVRCSVGNGPAGEPLRRYSPAPVCRWLGSSHGQHKAPSLAPLALFVLDENYMTAWHHLAATVLGGGGAAPFERSHGVPLFEYMGTHPRFSAMFNQGSTLHSGVVVNKMLDRFDGFAGVGVLVDAGGGTGAILQMIVSRHKHIRGINFDLPHVISQAPSAPGVDHIAGNMFESVPQGDAIFLKSVLHVKNDEDCIKILKNCHRSLPDSGKVIVMEIILPTLPEATPEVQNSFLQDMFMLNCFLGGKERTEPEFTRLARDSGFHGSTRSTYIFSNFWVLEFNK